MNHLKVGFGTTEGKMVPAVADAGFAAGAHPARRSRPATQGQITGWLTLALRVVPVLDRHSPRAKGGLVHLDAVRIEVE